MNFEERKKQKKYFEIIKNVIYIVFIIIKMNYSQILIVLSQEPVTNFPFFN